MTPGDGAYTALRGERDASSQVIATMRDPWDHPRTMVGVAILCEWAAEQGVDVGVLLRGSRITPRSLADPDELLEARQEIAVIRNLLDAFGDRPGLGVELGRLYHLTAYGYFGYLLAACSSVRETIRYGLRYALLTFAFSTITARIREPGQYVLAMDSDDVPEDIRRFVVERDVAATVQIQREVFPGPNRVPLREVRLPFATDETRRPPVYQDHFQVPVRFGRPRAELVFDVRYLDQVPPMANAHTALLMIEQCERIRTERLHCTGVSAQVRAHLLDRGSLDTSLESVAERLHYAPRTLRRRLANEGTTFRAILDEVRRGVAENLLRDPSIPRYEIAQLLGYQDWSSFLRARRRWQGGVGTRTPAK
ncbi:AraC family transcriptional regulator [Streptomyces purpurogeneiscleroticus]|uniref:AraC family transcriptional regulator n=1 Tax=Streptomyces purpurogeneiscleroticus TaxID=68259 RepID=UPI001CBC4148|nr:AraC family transcriptional regulator [Streptomyces purpurogeneiscleroticus]MBZ4019800.1 AraC family transcriptional regulator [Streptomyces purpurogeneiscleroticus]